MATPKDKQKHHLDIVRSRGIFKEALRGETFGSHPGYVDLRIRVFVYNGLTKREEKLPTHSIELLVSSHEEVDAMMLIMERSIKAWMEGLIKP